ncbi:MAG: DUF5335 family protein [Pyrinomonadaceae bacterium]
MSEKFGHPDWVTFLKFYSEQNTGRPTRIGIFEKGHGAVTDYWIESGLPFVGVDLDDSHGVFSLRIMAGSYSHDIRNVTRVSFCLSRDGDEDGLDVFDAQEHVTLLRFESRH